MEKKKQRLISIDPSVNNLGIAAWDLGSKKLLMYKLLHPLKDSKDDEFDKSYSMLCQIKQWKEVYGVNRIILEVPEHWAVSGFHARETGSIAKLMFVCGMIASLVDVVDEFKLVTPRQWKGQLPKEVVANRLKDHYLPLGVDLASINENVADAIEIGHYYIYGRV
jgi:hypothetical protein